VKGGGGSIGAWKTRAQGKTEGFKGAKDEGQWMRGGAVRHLLEAVVVHTGARKFFAKRPHLQHRRREVCA